MRMIKKITNYIQDNDFKIVYKNNMVNIINYDQIMEIKSDIITLMKEKKLFFIKGEDLKLNKLLDQELLITGFIKEISL